MILCPLKTDSVRCAKIGDEDIPSKRAAPARDVPTDIKIAEKRFIQNSWEWVEKLPSVMMTVARIKSKRHPRGLCGLRNDLHSSERGLQLELSRPGDWRREDSWIRNRICRSTWTSKEAALRKAALLLGRGRSQDVRPR